MIEQSTPQKFTNVNGYTISYIEYGPHDDNNKTLILLQSIDVSAELWWSAVTSTLSRHYRIIIPDVIGFGYSDKPVVSIDNIKEYLRENTMDFFINDFFRPFLDNLDISKASIIGSSFLGGHIATEFAIRFTRRVENLVLVSPGRVRTASPVPDRYILASLYPEHQAVYDSFREMVYDPDSVVISEEIVMDFRKKRMLPNAKYAFMSTLLDIRYAPPLTGRLSNITAPTLIVWGDKDRIVPLQYASEYGEIPESELVVIENCGHLPYIERPTTFNRILSEFL